MVLALHGVKQWLIGKKLALSLSFLRMFHSKNTFIAAIFYHVFTTIPELLEFIGISCQHNFLKKKKRKKKKMFCLYYNNHYQSKICPFNFLLLFFFVS